MQRAILGLVIGASWLSPTVDVPTCKAAKRMAETQPVIDSLPNDFWKEEILGWEKESWARMQIAMSRYAIGADGSDTPGQKEDNWWIKPTSDGEKALCSAQKMRKSGGFV
jgi:hypothetical protein